MWVVCSLTQRCAQWHPRQRTTPLPLSTRGALAPARRSVQLQLFGCQQDACPDQGPAHHQGGAAAWGAQGPSRLQASHANSLPPRWMQVEAFNCGGPYGVGVEWQGPAGSAVPKKVSRGGLGDHS